MKQAWMIIAFLLLALILVRECNRSERFVEVNRTIYRTDTIKGDSILVPYPVVQIVKEDSIIYRIIPAQIDSAEVARQYYAERYYKNHPLVDDTNIYITFDAMVSENRLRWVLPYVQIRRPQVINYYTTVIQQEQPQIKVFAGAGLGRSLTNFGLAPSVALLTKREHLYSLHYDLINKDVYFSVYFKIKR
jgi:hypothetical protein